MTGLLDLPTELLTMVTKKLSGKDCRKLSQVCRQMKKRIHLSIQMRKLSIHQFGSEVCVLEGGSGVQRRMYCLVDQSLTEIPSKIWQLLDSCSVSKHRITWILCESVRAELPRWIPDENDCISFEFIDYEAHFKMFDMTLVQQLFKIGVHCSLNITNDGFYEETVHNMIATLITTYVRSVKACPPPILRNLSVCETFMRACCSAVDEELERLSSSTRRLLQLVRPLCTEGDTIDDIPSNVPGCSWRGLVATVSEGNTLALSPEICFIENAASPPPRCHLFHEQTDSWRDSLPPSTSLVLQPHAVPPAQFYTSPWSDGAQIWEREQQRRRSLQTTLLHVGHSITHHELLHLDAYKQLRLELQKQQNLLEEKQQITSYLQEMLNNQMAQPQVPENQTHPNSMMQTMRTQLVRLQAEVVVLIQKERQQQLELQKLGKPQSKYMASERCDVTTL